MRERNLVTKILNLNTEFKKKNKIKTKKLFDIFNIFAVEEKDYTIDVMS